MGNKWVKSRTAEMEVIMDLSSATEGRHQTPTVGLSCYDTVVLRPLPPETANLPSAVIRKQGLGSATLDGESCMRCGIDIQYYDGQLGLVEEGYVSVFV